LKPIHTTDFRPRLLQQSQWRIASRLVFCLRCGEYSHSIVNANTEESTMNRSSLALAILSVAAFAAHADDGDLSGQFAASAAGGQATRAQVQAQLADYQKSGVNPWSTSYNPLASFKGEKTRAEVTGEYLASRNAVAAMTGEDSGSAFLASNKAADASRQLAGQPVRNAQ
jgi:hypothetical protein